MLHFSELTVRKETYDVIVMADVIEHLAILLTSCSFTPAFLSLREHGYFYSHANRAINFLSILTYNNYSVNNEHICWFCPMTLQEVINQSQLKWLSFTGLKNTIT